MKKLTLILMSILLVFSLVACSSPPQEEEEIKPQKPYAFSVLRKQLKLSKHSEKGESSSFSKEEFEDKLGENLTYITVEALPEDNKGKLIFNGQSVMKGQTIPANSLEYLKFVPATDCDVANFTFTCDSEGYAGNELVCEITFGDEANIPPVTTDSSLKTVSGISCEGVLSINEPNGDDFTINVITYPTDGYIKIQEDGTVTYTPKENFHGEDVLVYSVTDRFGNTSADTRVSIEVEKNRSGLRFADMENNSNHLEAHQMCSDNIMVYRYENGSYYFDPDATVSKMEFLVMAMCVSKLDADITAVADSVAEDDNGLSSGLKGYLSAAAENGLLRLENGKFSPNDEITVADAAYMISTALKLPSNDNTDSVYRAISAAVSAGIIDSDAESCSPKKVLTKSETAVILCRVRDYMTENNINQE